MSAHTTPWPRRPPAPGRRSRSTTPASAAPAPRSPSDGPTATAPTPPATTTPPQPSARPRRSSHCESSLTAVVRREHPPPRLRVIPEPRPHVHQPRVVIVDRARLHERRVEIRRLPDLQRLRRGLLPRGELRRRRRRDQPLL